MEVIEIGTPFRAIPKNDKSSNGSRAICLFNGHVFVRER